MTDISKLCLGSGQGFLYWNSVELGHVHRHTLKQRHFQKSVLHPRASKHLKCHTQPNWTFELYTSIAQILISTIWLTKMPRMSEVDRGWAYDPHFVWAIATSCCPALWDTWINYQSFSWLRRATGRLTDRPRSGCPRVTSRRQDREICLRPHTSPLPDGNGNGTNCW